MESLKEIPLSDDEIQDLIIAAKIEKKKKLSVEMQKSEMQKEAERPWTAEEMAAQIKRYVLHKNPKYIFDVYNRKVIWQLSLYFTNDKRFEELGFGSLNKGIMLAGNVGVGKSFLMECFMYNKRKCFQVFNCRNIEKEFRDNGFKALNKYNNILQVKPQIGWFFQTDLGICFDDFGEEEMPVRHFEALINVMERLIKERTDLKIPFPYTHYTTNLNWADGELEKRYTDTRALSRLTQSVNVIELAGEDKRMLI